MPIREEGNRFVPAWADTEVSHTLIHESRELLLTIRLTIRGNPCSLPPQIKLAARIAHISNPITPREERNRRYPSKRGEPLKRIVITIQNHVHHKTLHTHPNRLSGELPSPTDWDLRPLKPHKVKPTQPSGQPSRQQPAKGGQ